MEMILDVFLAIVIVVYLLSLSYILIYALTQLYLLKAYLKGLKKPFPIDKSKEETWPFVTVQLPIYNEKYVVERLIDCVCCLDYPLDKLEIQVLDDSTDETVDLVSSKVLYWQSKKVNIEQIRRSDKSGFKAGALQHGLTCSKGELMAIFDADFLPPTDFLKRMIPVFKDERVGAVQARWGHINRDESILTRLQSIALDYHFTIEQSGRNFLNVFINFNGTAGIWRKSCILDAGGWQSDTLTEDLDLSYRAQLKGWKMRYNETIDVPAELPPRMPSLKSQYYRWNKGGAEVAVKLLKKLLKSKEPMVSKWHGFWHLMNSSVFVAILLTGLMSVLLIPALEKFAFLSVYFPYTAIFILPSVIVLINYFVAHLRVSGRDWWYFLVYFPAFMAFYMGLSFHNTKAVFEGWKGKKTPFIRTPKEGKFQPPNNSYVPITGIWENWIELLIGLYFLAGIWIDIHWDYWYMLPFHVMLSAGFLFIGLYSFFTNRQKVFQNEVI